MIRKLFAALVLLALAVAPAAAELRYTTKIEARKVANAAPPANPMLAAMGTLVVGVMAPPGGFEFVTTLGPKGARVDYPKAYMMVPAGGSTLMRPDGSIVVLDHASKSYWRLDKPDVSIMAGLAPTITTRKTGESATVAGVPAERVTLSIRMKLPEPDGHALPAGFPAEIVLTGDSWVTARFASYTKVADSMVTGLGAFGLDKVAAGGFLMRSIMRGDMFGDQEVDSTITQISEGPVPADTFDIPAGYKEVPPEMPAMPMPQ